MNEGTSPARPLAGRRALVTGGAKGIGRAIALALASAGADVAITFRNSVDDAETTRAEIATSGVRALAMACDVSDEGSIAKASGRVLGEFGGLDLLVNNAGVFETASLQEISVEQWDAIFAVNTRGPFLMAKAFHAALKASHGRIVNMGSLGATHVWATHGHYCASKAALQMLSATMAKAWAPEVAVNCVAPGMIVTGAENQAYESFARKTPMGRNGSVGDVAAAVLFFATAPQFITGQVLTVDGGLGLR